MKKIFSSVLAISALTISACNNNVNTNEHKDHAMKKDTNENTAAINIKEVKTVAVTYTNVDAKANASIKKIFTIYLHIKGALANDNAAEAASGAKAVEKAINKLDKSLLTAEQKTVYDKYADGLKEQALQIAGNGNNIVQQRAHFSMMSMEIYDLAKAFGGGRALYHNHCPMYNESKGALWLSETKEVKNPYYGAEMLTCGTVEEVIE